MGDGSLSQDEIDALLQGTEDMLSPAAASPAPSSGQGSGSFSLNDRNAVRDIVNSIMSASAPALGGLLGNRNISISNAVIDIKNQDQLRSDFGGQYVQVSLDFMGALSGKNLMLFNYQDAGMISSVMMGNDAASAPADIDDAHLSTIQEFTNQLLSGLATQLSSRLGGGINTSPAMVSAVTNPYDLQLPGGNELIKITYDINVDGVVNSKLYHIMDANLGSGISRSRGGGSQQYEQPQQYQQAPQVQANISGVRFPPLDQGMAPAVGGNINLLLDVPMTLTVELGRTTQLVQDILGLGEGSIIELDKLAGEPVDLLVNGKLIAKGEVVVIDENFGVRVTDIVSPQQRLMSVQ
jgi:flagellar motor switch protein FliN/FliY